MTELLKESLSQQIMKKQDILFAKHDHFHYRENLSKYINFVNDLTVEEFDMYINTIKLVEINISGPPSFGMTCCACDKDANACFADYPNIVEEVFQDKGKYVEFLNKKFFSDLGILRYFDTDAKNKVMTEFCIKFVEDVAEYECLDCVYKNHKSFLDNVIPVYMKKWNF